ncbi:MAG: hypothetical protein EKK45_23530 [Curvibacter sp.]|nr:MAG: hypothetical protein EKK45_23530 [Curvibacter sp.]
MKRRQHLAWWVALSAGAAGAAPSPLPGTVPAGEATMRFLGWSVYQARLWVSPGFRAEQYASLPLALELLYLRDFSAEAIAKRSLSEMRRIEAISDEQGARWQAQLQALLPDVKNGDRLLGLHQPDTGARFLYNDRPLGALEDARFSRLFFGIWLSASTSEPALRQALLAPVIASR